MHTYVQVCVHVHCVFVCVRMCVNAHTHKNTVRYANKDVDARTHAHARAHMQVIDDVMSLMALLDAGYDW